MPNYRRANFPGGYYFFTLVTNNRRRLFDEDLARRCLRQAIEDARNRRPFEMTAFCLLPEHIHCLWKLLDGDCDFSIRWSAIKGGFSREFLKQGGQQGVIGRSRNSKGEASLWQRRFWEHQIRDPDDLQRHVDYIHYNPVKHGLVKIAEDWPWSTYHRFVEKGFYGGVNNFQDIIAQDENCFGE
jgi:putative transposase